jgi:hypothetical protein
MKYQPCPTVSTLNAGVSLAKEISHADETHVCPMIIPSPDAVGTRGFHACEQPLLSLRRTLSNYACDVDWSTRSDIRC